MTLRDHGSIQGLQFTNITIESLFYERLWLGGAEPIHITAMPRAVNTEVKICTSSMMSKLTKISCSFRAVQQSQSSAICR